MNKELVFSAAGEGEGDDIYRITENDGSFYFTKDHSSMFDEDDFGEGWEKPKPKKWDSFEAYFDELKQMGLWYRLHYYNVHKDYKEMVEKEFDHQVASVKSDVIHFLKELNHRSLIYLKEE